MEVLSRIIIDKDVPTYDYGEYIRALHEEVARDAKAAGLQKGRREGIKEGRQVGIKEGRQEERANLLRLINSGMTKEELSKRLSMPIL